MADGSSIVNFGDISKPATVLIEKVCNAVGIIYEPLQIKRKARAEIEVEKMKAIARIDLTDLESRAMERLIHQESRKQENIETIAMEAAQALPPSAKVQDLDEDWVAHFFKQCDTVSDKEMQTLWSSLLAGEATTPGTFSKRTVDFVSSIDKKDAALFTSFCQFVWLIGEVTPLIYDLENELYKKHGITFSALKHLDSIGLISFESTTGYRRTGFGKHTYIFYYGKPTLVEFSADEKNEIKLGKTLLTATGKELITICGAKPNIEFYEYVIEHWFKEGLILSSPTK